MDTPKRPLTSMDWSDVESKILSLKSKAAEADILREEINSLQDRLNLYNPDSVWPDYAINKCLNLPSNEELVILKSINDEQKLKNKELISKNEEKNRDIINLRSNISTLESFIKDFKQCKEDKNFLTEENKILDEKLKEFDSVSQEKDRLVLENELLTVELNKTLETVQSAKAKGNCEVIIEKLCNHVESLSIEKSILQNNLFSNENQIYILNGKISQLKARLCDPYAAIKIKLSLGMSLSNEEACLWTVNELQEINKKTKAEIVIIAEKLHSITGKLKEVEKSLKRSKPGYTLTPNDLKAALAPYENQRITRLCDGIWLASPDYSEGSTAVVSRNPSFDKVYDINIETTSTKLRQLAIDAHEMDAVFVKIQSTLRKIQMTERKKTIDERFFSFNTRRSKLFE